MYRFHQIGVKRFVIVINENDTYLDAYIKKKKLDEIFVFDVVRVQNNNDATPLIEGLKKTKWPAIVTFGDHLIDYRGFKEGLSNSTTLFIDSKVKGCDTENATKVIVENNKIKEIGIDIKDGKVFTDVLLLDRKTIEHILTLNQLQSIFEFIKQGLASTDVQLFDIDGTLWCHNRSKKAFKNAKSLLLKQTTKIEGELVGEYNRRISRRLTAVLSRTNITPNQVSLMNFILGIFAAIILLIPTDTYFNLIITKTPITFVIAGILTYFFNVIDGSDGELARLKFMASEQGALIDSVYDRFGEFFLIWAMAYGTYIQGKTDTLLRLIGYVSPDMSNFIAGLFHYGDLSLWYLAMYTAFIFMIIRIVGLLTKSAVPKKTHFDVIKAGKPKRTLKQKFKQLFYVNRGLLVLLLSIGMIFNQVYLMFYYVSLLCTVSTIKVVRVRGKIIKQREREEFRA